MAVKPQTVVALAVVAALAWPRKAKAKGKGKKKTATFIPKETEPELPPEGCGLYPWLSEEVDDAAYAVIEEGFTALEPEPISEEVAYIVYEVTPEGESAQWPPVEGDSRAWCIWDKIMVRVHLILAELADDAVNGDDDDDDDGQFDLIGPEDALPPYPEPGPVDIAAWENPDNYPTPGGFHQVYYMGGDKARYPEGHPGRNSATTTKHLAQKALYSFAYTVTGDLEKAKAAGDDPAMWRAYRALIDCSPYNHALFAARFEAPHKYDSPHGLQLAMLPGHDDVRFALSQGRTPMRLIDVDDPQMVANASQPYPWLPPLDPEAFLDGEIRVDPEYWPSGDSKIMPPPEVLALGIGGVDPERFWGCEVQAAFGFPPDDEMEP